MRAPARPRLLGIDDGPFVKGVDATTPLVAALMEGGDRLEGVAIRPFAVDGDDVTAFLARWIRALRFHAATHAVVLGGVTIAGLAVVDLAALAVALELPVIAVSRRDPSDHRVVRALLAAGLAGRTPCSSARRPRGRWTTGSTPRWRAPRASGLGRCSSHRVPRARCPRRCASRT
jgi:endonuclease V-like protein UPF0215 family